MKFIASLLTLVFAATMTAQEFEGTITWKMQAQITDPAMQSKMQAAQARMASPEMQAALQNPEMQAMMAQNPQMKAMIERQMAALKGPASDGGQGGLFPTGFTLRTKGARSLVRVEGGMFPSEVLTQSDLNAAYQIDRASETYRRLPQDQSGSATGPAPRVTRTAETAKILGYTCTRCVVETSAGPEKAAYSIWVTKDIKGFDPARLKNMRVGRAPGPNFMDQLDGVPMKMEITTPQAKLVMEVSAIQAESLAAALFELPEGFSEAAH